MEKQKEFVKKIVCFMKGEIMGCEELFRGARQGASYASWR